MQKEAMQNTQPVADSTYLRAESGAFGISVSILKLFETLQRAQFEFPMGNK